MGKGSPQPEGVKNCRQKVKNKIKFSKKNIKIIKSINMYKQNK